ncbi:uncharacterized protein LOC144042773 [Vanacampus margaritifer]
MESKIIAAVSEHPELYDTSCCHYRDIAKRKLAWITVSKEVGISVEKSRRKWKSLRDTYLKQSKKEQVDEREDEAAAVMPQEKEDSENGKKRHKSRAAVCEKDMKIQEQLFLHLKRHASSAPAPIASRDELFLSSLVPSLQRLPPQQKERIKFEIHKLIYEAI